MDTIINVLAGIGAMCILRTIGFIILLACNFWKEMPEYDDEYTLLMKENESLREQLSQFQAREQSRKIEDAEALSRMFEELEREELIYMNT